MIFAGVAQGLERLVVYPPVGGWFESFTLLIYACVVQLLERLGAEIAGERPARWQNTIYE